SPSRLALEPIDFRPWRLFLAFHLTLTLATFIAAFLDTGYYGRLSELTAPGFQFVFSCLFLAVAWGAFIPVCVAPIAILILFVRAITHDKRYAVAGIAELFLTGAHLFVLIPMCQ